MTDQAKRIIVIGAGPAGLLAAFSAARMGAEVILCERNDRIGKKLRITGKGRCNLTNDCDVHQLVQNLPGNGRFLYSAFSVFDSQACQRFFTEAGLPLKVERGQRVFPVSDKAQDVVDTLSRLITEAGVKVRYHCRVRQLILSEDEMGKKSVAGVRLDRGELLAEAVIATTGGASYPLTGSSGDGYALAKAAGHTIITPRGALVPQETVEEWPKQLQGLSLRNVRLSLYRGETKLGEEFGEMLFTHFGVSGPMVLSLSRLLLDGEGEYRFRVNLKPALSQEQLDLRLQRDFQKNIRRQFKNSLDELLPQKLIPVFINLSGIAEDKPVHSITRAERQQLVQLLTSLEMTVARPRPLEEAIVTAGGVSVREVDPKTMASKLCKGLYFAGEVLDVDGYTGGFNLQAAFAMGFVAGKAAAAESQ